MLPPSRGLTRPQRRLLWSAVLALLGGVGGWMLLGKAGESWVQTRGLEGVRSDTFGLFGYLTRSVHPVTIGGRPGPEATVTTVWHRPALFMTVLASVGLAVALAALYRFGLARRLPRERCDECGYDLRGRPDAACPECGHDARAMENPPAKAISGTGRPLAARRSQSSKAMLWR